MFSTVTSRISLLLHVGDAYQRSLCLDALHTAIDAGRRQQVKDLLAGDPWLAVAADDHGDTPLHWAVRATAWDRREDRRVIVTCLLEAGADRAARDRQGATPIEVALQCECEPPLIELLCRYDRQAHTLHGLLPAAGQATPPAAQGLAAQALAAHALAAQASQAPRQRQVGSHRSGGARQPPDDGAPGARELAGSAVKVALEGIATMLRNDVGTPNMGRAEVVEAVLPQLIDLVDRADTDCLKQCLSCLQLLLAPAPRLDHTHLGAMLDLYDALLRGWVRASHWKEGFCYAHHVRRLLAARNGDLQAAEQAIDRVELAMVREHLSQWTAHAQVLLRAALFDLAGQCTSMAAPLPMLERAQRLLQAVEQAVALKVAHGMPFSREDNPREAVPVRQLTAAIANALDRARRTAAGAADFDRMAQCLLPLAASAGALGLAEDGAAWCDNVVRTIEQEECVAALRRYDCSAHRRLAQALRQRPGPVSPLAGPPQVHWRTLRDSLGALRRQAAEAYADLSLPAAADRSALRDWQTPLGIERVQEQLTARYEDLVEQIAAACRRWMMSEPPCPFALVGLGSMSRGDMSPYSDFEYALLLAEPADHDTFAHNWFRTFGRLFDLAVHSIGESAPGTDHPLPAPHGFEVDAGVRVGASAMAWSGTPEQLADMLRQRSLANANAQSDADQGLHFSLLTPCLACGDPALLQRLSATTARVLDAPLRADDPTRYCAREDLALRQLHADLRRLGRPDNGPSDAPGADASIDLKRDYLGPLNHALTSLLLLFGYQASLPRAGLARLDAMKRFSAPFLADWRWAIAVVQTIRHGVQLREQRRQDVVPAAALSDQERELLGEVQARVVRPLWETLPRLLGAWRWGASGAALRGVRMLDNADPALYQLGYADEADAERARLVWNARPLRTIGDIRRLAGTLAVRRAEAAELLQAYMRAMDSLPERDYATGWRVWRDALEAVPGSTVRLRRLGEAPARDGWRGQASEAQAAFHRCLQQWLVDPRDATVRLRLAAQPDGAALAAPGAADDTTSGLSPAIARQLFDADGHVLPKPARQPGTHCVLPVRFEADGRMRVWWVKFDPEAPGNEAVLHALDRRLTGGQGMPSSVVMRLHAGTKVHNAQVIEGVEGRSLAHALEREPSLLQAIDRGSFTRALLRELVCGPGDDKADDYFLVEHGTTHRLVRIDNARAALGAMRLPAADGIATPVRSLLFCLDQMMQPLDLAVLEETARLKPEALLCSWLKDAARIERDHRRLFSGDEVEAAFTARPHPGLLAVATPSPSMPALLQLLEDVRALAAIAVRFCIAPTGMQWLRSLHPPLAIAYLEQFDRYPVRGSDPGAPGRRWAAFDGSMARYREYGEDAERNAARRAERFGITAVYPPADAVQPWRIKAVRAVGAGVAMSASVAVRDRWGHIGGRHDFVAGLFGGNEMEDLMFAWLPLRHRVAAFDAIRSVLQANPQALTAEQQRRLLGALAGTPFVCLELRAFAAALTDDLLEALLRGAGASLLRLDISGCWRLTAQALRHIEAHASRLLTLRCRAVHAGRPGAAEPLTAVNGSPWRSPLALPHLEQLDLGGNGALQSIRLVVPSLTVLHVDGCHALRELQLSDANRLCELDARQCEALAEPALKRVARHAAMLARVQLADCALLRHIGLRETHPWLLAHPWNDWSDAGVAALRQSLQKPDGSAYQPMPRYVVDRITDWLREREVAIAALNRVCRDSSAPPQVIRAATAAVAQRESVAAPAIGQATATLVGMDEDSLPSLGIGMLVPALTSASNEGTRIAAAVALGHLIAIPSREDVARWAQRDAAVR